MQTIKQFEKPIPAGYTQAAWDCRNQMFAKLAERLPLSTSTPRRPMPHELPADQIAHLLLTPKQAEGIEIVQKLCGHIRRAAAQINTTLITYELAVPPIYLHEVANLLWQLDEAIIAARAAARRLGIRAVQPQVRLTAPTLKPIATRQREAA
ncbi:hypothetical protein [Eikenella sp. Marseille-P7795]|uniref:hypothetical protein n=1 Tax=Eikenella sp. Marseille-P7795 TaxID=2866577 RepID=UPI001CE3F39C|nr:hypothetical protein [Eikenella sp. Marseille-P7795]